jgi:hypothetical protein
MFGGIGLSNPQVTLASNPSDPDGNLYTGSLAGKPINGYSYDTSNAPLQWSNGCLCYVAGIGTGHGIAYGVINSGSGPTIVLLYPWHGRAASSFTGKTVYGPNGSKIGFWGPDVCNTTCASEHDLAYIVLYNGNWPAHLNRVYLQDASTYWTVTTEPSTTGSCGNLSTGSEWGDVVLQEFNYSAFSPYLAPRTGTIPGTPDGGFQTPYVSHPDGQSTCVVWTNLYWHNPNVIYCPPDPCPYRDSGSPWRLNKDLTSLWAVSSGASWISGQGWTARKLWVTPLYNGLQVYKDEPGYTFHLCHDAGCS